ncbi:YhgE/Pip family protein [Enterococcus sp. LJL90]
MKHGKDALQHIKNTFTLYILDWKRIFKNPIATLLIIALMVIPSLYAWFNIKALWDPYSNTGELPVAVYSEDQDATFNDQTINIGDQVIEELHDNDQLGWVFVKSEADLEEGVKSGKYYAGIVIPSDFSEDLLSFTTGDIKKPQIEYTLNQKINAIAPKITDKGATTIQTMISSQFVGTASDTLVKVFNEVGYDIDANLLSINKLESLILDTDENMDTIDGYLNQVLELNDQLPDIENKLDLANQFVDYLPEVDALGEKLIDLNDKMPQLKQQASIILTLQEKIPEIQSAGQQLAEIDSDFDSVANTMTEGIDEAKQGLQIIQQVQTALPEIEQLGQQADEFATATKNGAEQLQNALPSITSSVKVVVESIGNIATTTSSISATIQSAIADNQLTPDEKAAIKQSLQNFSDSLTQQQTTIDNLISFLNDLQNAAGNTDLATIISSLQNAKTNLATLQTRVNNLISAVDSDDFINQANSLLTELQTAADAVANVAASIDADSIGNTVSTILTDLITTIDTAQGLLNQAQQIDFNSLLASTSTTVSNAISILEKYQAQLPAIRQEVHDASTMLNDNMDTIVAAINKGADLYNNTLPTLETRLNTAANFLKNDWPGIEADIQNTLTTVNEKLPELKTALSSAVDLINNDWPSIKAGIQKAAGAIRQGESEYDLGEIIKLLKSDATAESDFFANPVDLQENILYPIDNNGSASTPFYTALCLWVGAVLFSSIATTEYFLDKKDKGKFSKRETYSARLLTFLTMGLAQGIIVVLGNIFLLGVDVAQPVYSVIFSLLIALVFSMMVYTLVALFGNVGKGIAIIILVLSISGGGGNYPIQVSGKFFQLINPYLPFTYAVDLLRESAGGIYWPNAMTYIAILIGIFIVFAVIGVWFYPYIVDKLKVLTKKSHESHIFH